MGSLFYQPGSSLILEGRSVSNLHSELFITKFNIQINANTGVLELYIKAAEAPTPRSTYAPQHLRPAAEAPTPRSRGTYAPQHLRPAAEAPTPRSRGTYAPQPRHLRPAAVVPRGVGKIPNRRA
ncbi:unnamed protein product [Boreogadus saida]